MSRNFLAVPSMPYVGVPYSTPITVCDPSKVAPALLPFPIQWLIYGAGSAKPNVAVTVNISQPGQNAIIDKIRSVYIDNLGNNVPVYVYFPSSGYSIACAPNSQGWFTALTNDLTAIIVGEGFTDADRLSQTFVAFSNTAPTPYQNAELIQQVALYRASPTIQRGNVIYNSIYAPPALGDQVTSAFISLSAASVVPVLSQQVGFYILTAVSITAENLPFNTGQLANALTLTFESSGASGVLFFTVLSTNTKVWDTVLNISAMQLKINANEQWQLRASSGGAFYPQSSALMTLIFTYQPS